MFRQNFASLRFLSASFQNMFHASQEFSGLQKKSELRHSLLTSHSIAFCMHFRSVLYLLVINCSCSTTIIRAHFDEVRADANIIMLPIQHRILWKSSRNSSIYFVLSAVFCDEIFLSFLFSRFFRLFNSPLTSICWFLCFSSICIKHFHLVVPSFRTRGIGKKR